MLYVALPTNTQNTFKLSPGHRSQTISSVQWSEPRKEAQHPIVYYPHTGHLPNLSWCQLLCRTRKTTGTLHRGRTNRIGLTHDPDLDLWPRPSIPWELLSWPTHMQKFKVNGESVPKIEWKQMDGRTDGRTQVSSLPHMLTRSVQMGTVLKPECNKTITGVS